MLPTTLVAIHQPNFLPWWGFFDKIRRADVFILMDNAQFQKTGGTWTNRVKLLVNREAAWVTVPVVRAYHGTRRVAEMQIDDRQPWRAKLVKTINASYARAPHAKEVLPFLEQLLATPTDNLGEFNVAAIRRIVELLGMDSGKLVLGSTLGAKGNATELLIEMVRAVGGTAYLCGGGTAGYQQDELFADAGVELVYQQFAAPQYPQLGHGDFVPGLSIIDALLHCGVQTTAQMLHGIEARSAVGSADSRAEVPPL